MWRKWNSTVWRETNSASATCLVVSPLAAISATLRSLGVSDSGPVRIARRGGRRWRTARRGAPPGARPRAGPAPPAPALRTPGQGKQVPISAGLEARQRAPQPQVRSRPDAPPRSDSRRPATRAGHRDPELAYDNRAVEPGTLFFCVPGFTRDGHEFAPDAIARGAVALVVERPLDLGVPEIKVPSVRAAMAPAAAAFYGDPTATLQTVGVTGTNGKTTTAFLVRALLEADGRQTGLLGTVKSVIGGAERPVRADHARGDRPAADVPGDARRGRCRVRDGGLLARARAPPRRRDPLRGGDLHEPDPGPPRLPRDDGGLLPGQAAAVRRRASAARRDQRRRSVRGRDWRRSSRGGHVRDRDRGDLPGERRRDRPRRLALHGDWPRRRDRAAARRCRGTSTSTTCSARSPRCGRSASRSTPRPRRSRPRGRSRGASSRSTTARGSRCSSTTPTRPTRSRTCCARRGRLDRRPPARRVRCGGDRDRGKRPLMGEIATRLADRVIVTSDNPRSEDPEAIIDEILVGTGPAVEHEADRRAAIAQAIAGARRGRRRRDRRQGPRAGAGVRGRAQDPVRRRDGRPGGARGRPGRSAERRPPLTARPGK